MRAIPALLVTLCCAAAPTGARADTITVQPGEPVQTAVDGAAPGDTVRLAPGTHTGPVVIDQVLALEGPGATLTGYAQSGVVVEDSATVTVRDLTIVGSCGNGCTTPADPATPADAGILARGATVAAVGVTVTGNPVAIRAAGAPRLDVLDSRLTTNGTGVQVVDAQAGVTPAATRGVIHGSTISDAERGVVVHDGNTGDAVTPSPSLRADRIVGTSSDGVAANVPLAASGVWWGCNGGPGSAGCTTVSADVDAARHLVLRLAAGPGTIATGGGTANLTADVTRDGDGTTTGTAFPDGTAVSFATDRGTVSPASPATSAGAAGATLTSGADAGTATVTATLDGATVSAPVTIVAPQPPTTVTETQTVTVTQPPTTVTETQTVTVTPPPTTEPTVTPTPAPTATPAPAVPTGAELLAAARKAIGRKVYRLTPSLTPGVGYVDKTARSGRGTVTIPDQDVVSLMVVACPEKACDVGVSAKVQRSSKRKGRKLGGYALRRATFSLEAGRQRVVAVRLTKAQRQGIRRARTATMVVTAAVSGPAGDRSKRTLRLRVKVRRAT